MMHPSLLADEDLLADCEIRFTRRSGPGGQHRNKTETAVILKHLPTGLSAEANEGRSQAENRRAALFRLRLVLAVGFRTQWETELPVTSRWASRVVNRKILIAVGHHDFPAILAEALDRWHRNQGMLDATATELGISNSQLVKLFKLHRPALDFVNKMRAAVQLPPLR